MTEYRNSQREHLRIADLMCLVPRDLASALDVGARDGFISRQLTRYFTFVTALDLDAPSIDQENIRCVRGDATNLRFGDKTFDLVLCSEVLEHIPSDLLTTACDELVRVAKEYILIGVPYRQDTRLGRTTCYACGRTNPPWGHVNRFDEYQLQDLFPQCAVEKISFVGQAEAGTNSLASLLMNLAGNPYGTYSQDEPCVHCGAKLQLPPQRTLWRKILTRAAVLSNEVQRPFARRHANWIHILFRKESLRDTATEMLTSFAQKKIGDLLTTLRPSSNDSKVHPKPTNSRRSTLKSCNPRSDAHPHRGASQHLWLFRRTLVKVNECLRASLSYGRIGDKSNDIAFDRSSVGARQRESISMATRS